MDCAQTGNSNLDARKVADAGTPRLPIRVLAVCSSNFGIRGLSTQVFNWGNSMPPESIVFDYFSSETFVESTYTQRIEDKGGLMYSATRSPGERANPLRVFAELRRLLLSTDSPYEIVHIHADTAHKAAVRAAAAKAGGAKKIIVHSHSAGMDALSFFRRMCQSVCRQILPCISTDWLACSDKAAQWMFPRRVQGRVRLVSNDVDARRFEYDEGMRNEARADLGFAEEDLVLGFVGQLVFQKNPQQLIRIFEATHRKHANARLLMVGDGDLRKETEGLIRSLGLEKYVTKISHTNNPEVCMQAMDVFCLPSRYEGNPLVVGEALASGLPCVVSDEVTKMCDPLGNVSFISAEDVGAWEEAIWNARVLREGRAERSEEYSSYKVGQTSSAVVLEKLYKSFVTTKNKS